MSITKGSCRYFKFTDKIIQYVILVNTRSLTTIEQMCLITIPMKPILYLVL